MKYFTKQHIALLFIAFAVVFGVSASRAANLASVTVALSNHKPSQTGVTQTITFTPFTSIAAAGDLKITYPSQFDLTNVVASADVSVSGGLASWNAVVNGDLNNVTNILTLGWTGTLSAGTPVTVTVAFTKNPAVGANYTITIATGTDGFVTATDSRTIPLVITDGGVGIAANVPYPETNPTIMAITPTETIVISSGATQVISFVLTDVNNNNIDYTISPSGGNNISVAPTPTTPATSTQNGVTITFTYFANGTTGNQTITITADDNENTFPAVVTYDIQLFVI